MPLFAMAFGIAANNRLGFDGSDTRLLTVALTGIVFTAAKLGLLTSLVLLLKSPLFSVPTRIRPPWTLTCRMLVFLKSSGSWISSHKSPPFVVT